MAPRSNAQNHLPTWGDARSQLRPQWEELSQFLDQRLARADENPSPKYKVLQDGLVEAIRTGVIADSGLLPTENELTRITPFSLGTVQRALKNMVGAGLIVRKAGVGTIVAPWRRELENPLHTKFVNPEGRLYRVFTEILSRRRIADAGPWDDHLGPDSKTLLIKRRLLIERPKAEGGEFPIYNEFFVDECRFEVFRTTPKRTLNGVNFKRLMAEEFNLKITRITNFMKVARVRPDIAEFVPAEAGEPCILQRVCVYSDEGPLYYQEYWLPSYAPEVVIDTSLESLAEI